MTHRRIAEYAGEAQSPYPTATSERLHVVSTTLLGSAILAHGY